MMDIMMRQIVYRWIMKMLIDMSCMRGIFCLREQEQVQEKVICIERKMGV